MSKDKQKAYRERKKRAEFLSNDFSVTKCMEDAKALGNHEDMIDLIAFVYDRGGEKAVKLLCLEIYGFTQMVIMARSMITLGREAKL